MTELDMDWYVYGWGENAMSYYWIISRCTEPIHTGRLINGYVNYKSFPMDDLQVSYREDRLYQTQRNLVTRVCTVGASSNVSSVSFPVLGVKGDYS